MPGEAPPFDELVHEARNERLHAGEGALWLDELFDALPDDIAISVEVPRSIDAGKSVDGARQARRRRRAEVSRGVSRTPLASHE